MEDRTDCHCTAGLFVVIVSIYLEVVNTWRAVPSATIVLSGYLRLDGLVAVTGHHSCCLEMAIQSRQEDSLDVPSSHTLAH